MRMDGMGVGILKGLGVTFRHLVNTFVDDIRYAGRKYFNQDIFEERQGLKAAGAYTVQYPDEKIAVPERFRFVPFLVVNDYDDESKPGDIWCTSCGICAKVCPPQCIWIVRGEDPVTKRPVPEPEAFYIDIDICMNCGYCSEFCPFDAIKMDHDYELASYDRTGYHIYDKAKLSKEYRYWLSISPTRAVEEAQDRGGWEHKDVIKERRAESKKTGKEFTPDFSVYPGDLRRQRQAAGVSEEAATTIVAEAAPQIDADRLAKVKSLREQVLGVRRSRN
ncbi:MAG: 4Fe-4S binding protein [Phototrophicaceae bacterium]